MQTAWIGQNPSMVSGSVIVLAKSDDTTISRTSPWVERFSSPRLSMHYRANAGMRSPCSSSNFSRFTMLIAAFTSRFQWPASQSSWPHRSTA
jgi:hypothetical protein